MSAPQGFDDAVIGAGIIGLAHAYHLAKCGRKVIVFERNARAQGASIRNFGMLWPIGQPAGQMRSLALRSREIWLGVLEQSGCWFDECGSLHLAYREDEAQVLREFVASEEPTGFECRLEDRADIAARSKVVVQTGLIAGLWSSSETCVDPREVIAKLPAWLHDQYGVQFAFGHAVTHCSGRRLTANGTEFQATNVYLCSGDDLQSLYPETLLGLGLNRCKLQMMRTRPMRDARLLGPMLAAGLTLRHYKAFENCPSLSSLKKRVLEETPLYDKYGIHVMASQNGSGEIVIGDSHEYGSEIEPFDKSEIDRLILGYLASFADIPDLQIAGRWHGMYVKHPSESYVILRPEPGITIVTGVGGAGMTLSFGLAEKVVHETLESC